MTKTEMVSRVAKEVGLSQKKVKSVIDVFFKNLSDVLKKHDRYIIQGFGTFKVVKRKARKGVNPRTKQKITIPEKHAVKFKPSKKLI